MAAEHFCLRWNNHQSTLVSVFDDLLESGTLVDCTLAADGQYLKAHKVVLSACSPYLGMLLSQHYDMHPIIILKDVKYEELKAMLDYMYRGEVNISQEQLSAFLKTAESLKIKGLTDTGGTVDESICKQQGRPPSSSESTTSAPVDEPSSPQTRDGECGSPAPKRRKRSRVSQSDDSSNQAISENRSDNSCDRASRNEYSGSGVNNHKASRSEYAVNSVKPELKQEPLESGHYEDEDHNVDDSDGAEEAQKAGPSNGASSGIKGTSWHLSADSTGDETQLSATQGKRIFIYTTHL